MLIRKFILLMIFFILIGGGAFAYQLDKALMSPLNVKKDSFITIKAGSSLRSLSQKLVEKKWIDNHFWLKVYSRLFPEQVKIKAGTYLIANSTTLQGLLAQLIAGKEYQFSVTFIEGTRFMDAVKTLHKHPHIAKSLTGSSAKQIALKLGIAQDNPEGWLFPDTYAFTAGTADIVLLKRAYNNMRDTVSTLWANRANNLPYKTPYQALIMASIIEKETSHIPEQPTIAGVFVNRLRKKMRLQTDPTVIYGLGERYKGDITRAHLREKTRYNTYRINGLPPTPIALAGLPALKATLHPQRHNYYYFVSGGNGEHVFSRTLSEHNTAVRQYLNNQKNR